jgi:hypothetical protein
MAPPVVHADGELELDGTKVWTVPCPRCGRQHLHGAQPGHRLAHCGRGAYVILPPKEDPS